MKTRPPPEIIPVFVNSRLGILAPSVVRSAALKRAMEPKLKLVAQRLPLSSNSIANELKVVFKGKRNTKTMLETGTVAVGKTRFRYRTFPYVVPESARPPQTP